MTNRSGKMCAPWSTTWATSTARGARPGERLERTGTSVQAATVAKDLKWLDCVKDVIRTPPGCGEFSEAEYKMHFRALEFYPVPVTGTGDAETKKNIIAATIGWIIKRTTNLSKDLITKTLSSSVMDAYRLRAGRRLNEGMARLSDPVVLVCLSYS